MNISTHLLYDEKNASELIKLFDSIINMSEDGLYVCDKEGKTILVNDALIEITKISKEEFYSHRLDELIQKEILPSSCAYQTLRTKRKHNMMIDYYNGKKAILTSTPVFDDNQEIVCVVSNVRDITKLKNLQEQLEESNRKNIAYQELLFVNEHLLNDVAFIYRSKKMEYIVSLASKFAENDSPILLLGESGVGKDVLAEYIHKKSKRPGKFVRINCGAIPTQLLESELFGYEKGAFTGANATKIGLFELSHKGTIFLDEIGDMPYELQVKLLNVLQNREIRRIGGTKPLNVDMRVIAATNLDLSEMVEKKQFRKDLYYRLNVLSLTIPPLRERPEDITALTIHFLNNLNKKYKEKNV